MEDKPRIIRHTGNTMFVTNPEMFPPGTTFRVEMGEELLQVACRQGNELLVARAYYGSPLPDVDYAAGQEIDVIWLETCPL